MALITAVVSIVVAVLGLRSTARERRAVDARADVHAAQDALRRLRGANRRRAARDAAAPDALALADLEDDFETAIERTLSDAAVVRAREYVEVGRLYGLRDPDTGEGAEEATYRSVTDALRAHLKANR